MLPTRPWLRLLALVGLAAARPERAVAQVGSVSSAQVINLAVAKTSKLTLSVVSGTVQTLASFTDGTTNNFPTPVGIQTQWDLNPGQTGTVQVIGWFSTPAQALFNGAAGTSIPSSYIKGRVTTGVPVTYTAFTQNAVGGVGVAGGSLRLLNVTITGANKTASRTDNLDLQLDLTAAPSMVPGTYTGTLNIQAVTQ
jgi:hypothetical protein